MRVVIASLLVIGSFTLPAPAAGQARGAGASGKGACSLLPLLSSVVPTLNSTRYADNVWFASRLDSRLLKCVRLTAMQPFGRCHFFEHIP